VLAVFDMINVIPYLSWIISSKKRRSGLSRSPWTADQISLMGKPRIWLLRRC